MSEIYKEKCYDCDTRLKIIWIIGDNTFGMRVLCQCPKCKAIWVRDVAVEERKTDYSAFTETENGVEE